MVTRAGREGEHRGTRGRSGGGRAGRARESGRRAADSPALRYLARAGFLARGVLYAIIGWIAVEVAFGSTSQQADKTGALHELGRSPAGEFALWLLLVGFFGMALWRLAGAALGPSSAQQSNRHSSRGGEGGHHGGIRGRLEGIGSSSHLGNSGERDRVKARLSSLGKGVVYAVLGWGVLEYAIGLGSPPSDDKESVDLTATLLRYPGGQVLVAVIGVVLVGAGLFLAWQAWRKKFKENLELGQMSAATRRVVEWLGRAGGIARGVVFATVGVFLVVAAVEAQPGQAKGLDSALRALAQTPAGPPVLVVVAVGLIMFGLFSGCEARWRRV